MSEWRMMFAMSTLTLIGTVEVAARLQVSRSTVRRLVEAGTLNPAHTAPGGPAGAFLFDPAEVDRVRAERKAEQ